MSYLKIIDGNKTYDPNQDVWIDENGRMFVKNQFDPNDHIFVDISDQRWILKRLGEGEIDWDELCLPYDIEVAFKIAIRIKLKRVSCGYLNKCRLMLAEFGRQLNPDCRSLVELKMSDINKIWQNMTPYYLSFFRSLYSYLASQNIGGASITIAAKLKEMNARHDVRSLKDVLFWHPTKGALTQAEEIVLRYAIETRSNRDIKHFTARLFCWLLMVTLKRGKQIRELQSDCLKYIEKNGVKEFFVSVKPVKNQTGDPKRWWLIPEDLYIEMQSYSSNPTVRNLQETYDRFLVIDCPSLRQDGVISAADAKQYLQNYINITLRLISPRTGERLHVTPNRIRHTGATRLAFSGVSRDILAEILEHDETHSCQAYIDAVGSELCPSLDKAERNMGSLFMQLNQIYFQGKIIEEITNQPIIIPDFSESTITPLFVGSCTRDTCKEGLCYKHPFIGCYNGCSSFLAWREADHYRALDFADKELERWHKATGDVNQTSTIQEFEDLKMNIKVVIERIQLMKEVA
jgi:Phage integrase family